MRRGWESARFRILFVSVEDGRVVVDGVAERGTEVGSPGSPVTLLLEGRDPCEMSVALRRLRAWTAGDELVEVALTSDHGASVAALHCDGSVLLLRVLALSS